MRCCDILLEADYIITQDARRTVLENGAIAIQQGRIMDAGPSAELRQVWQGHEELDLRGHLIMPGLINSHTHASMTFLRGLADDKPLMDWLNNTVFPVEKRLTPEIVRLGAMLGYAEMLATGTTACMDMYIFEEAVLEAADECGIRCAGGEAVFGFPSAACPDYRSALNVTADLAEKYADHERISIAVNPHSVYTTTPEILRACRLLALELDLPIHIHLAETQSESGQCLKAFGLRPVAYCRQQGLLDTRVIAAHTVDVCAEEAEILAAANVSVVHNPSSNMKLASGTAPLACFLEAGMLPALGTDGPASNNQLNMFAEMGRAALLHKLASGNPESAPAGQILDMATLGGAKAFGRKDMGRLEKGCAADLIAIDIRRPNMQPLYDPISQAVYAASGHEVSMTMVDGEILYREGKYGRFDYGSLLAEIRQLRDFVLSH